MIGQGLQAFNNHVAPVQRRERRVSILQTSNPKNDGRPIDFILVYHPLSSSKDGKANEKIDDDAKREKRRTKFENALKKQGLILETISVGVFLVK